MDDTFREERMLPNYEKSLPARIRQLEVQRLNAVALRDWTKASEIVGRIAELKAELHHALKPRTRVMSKDEIVAADARLRDRRRWWKETA